MCYKSTLNSTCNEVAFNEKSAITKENLCTKYFPLTYKYVILNEKLPITKQNLHIFFFVIGGVECGVAGAMLYTVYASKMESILEVSNQTEEKARSSWIHH